jgi:hypothetical protein
VIFYELLVGESQYLEDSNSYAKKNTAGHSQLENSFPSQLQASFMVPHPISIYNPKSKFESWFSF